MIVKVGSANRMKVDAVKRAFRRFFPKVRVEGLEVPSGVSPQPVSLGEVVRGARNRARAAFRDCDYAVGIEAGSFRLAALSPDPFQITMACIRHAGGETLGGGPFFELPGKLAHGVVKSDTGSVALVLKGKVTRGGVTRDAVLMALSRLVSPELYLP
jgi:inosine/xanthosine triphosphatase